MKLKERISIIGLNTGVIFVWLFFISLPFPFYFLSIPAKLLSSFAEIGISFSAQWIFNSSESQGWKLFSDSLGMYIHTFNLLIISAMISLLLKRKLELLYKGIPYLLSLFLLSYGLNKLMLRQFYFPEASTLHTEVRQIDKDLLFWSAMGSSKLYNYFMGAIEVIPALLLLFRSTRILGGLISLMVLINVFFINLGFDISVKLLTSYLLFLSILVIYKKIPSLINCLKGKPDPSILTPESHSRKSFLIKYLALFLILSDTLLCNPELYSSTKKNHGFEYYGAYEINDKNSENNRMFINSTNCFVVEKKNGKVQSQHFQTLKPNQLKTRGNTLYTFEKKNNQLTLSIDDSIVILKPLIKDYPIAKDDFKWISK
jgi:hypothetical protein